jgi:uncharacterized protein
MFPYLFLRHPAPTWRRERVETPDGDFVDFDWLELPSADPNAPVLILFHGLEGSSGSHYVAPILEAAALRGWRGVVPHFRGCSGEANRLPRAYHSGDAAEIDWMIGAVRARIGSAPLRAVGVSLGGNALLDWLGLEADKSTRWLRSAAAISAPLDLVASGTALDQGFNRLYCRNFLSTLVPKALDKARRFPGLCDVTKLKAVRTIREFDDLVTAPLHGFRDVVDYWTRASSKPHLKSVRLPTLLLNALNDPFVPGSSLPGPADVSDAVTLEQPRHGGHVGFLSGPFPGRLDWLTRRLLHFFDR